MADHNLYIFYAIGLLTFLILYVDDLILTGSRGDHIFATKAALSQEFEMTDMGLLHFFLSLKLEIRQTPQGYFISQQRYIHELLESF